MEVGSAGGRDVLRKTGREFHGGDLGRVSSVSRFRQCRLESRKERLPSPEEPLATETYKNKPQENGG